MTSTTEFVTATATLTVHKPPGVKEAVILIAAMEAVASITLPEPELRRLATLLVADENAAGPPTVDAVPQPDGNVPPG